MPAFYKVDSVRVAIYYQLEIKKRLHRKYHKITFMFFFTCFKIVSYNFICKYNFQIQFKFFNLFALIVYLKL